MKKITGTSSYPYLDAAVYNNFYEMLKAAYDKAPETAALRYRKKDTICDISYERLIKEISAVYNYLSEVIGNGGIIGIVSENRYEYITIYLGAALWSVIAPMDKETVPEAFMKQVNDYDISVLFYTDKTKYLTEHIDRDKILCINTDGLYEKIKTYALPAAEFFCRIKNTDSDRFSVLAFTSGTTDSLKGVMLSQRNITSALRGAIQNNPLKSPALAVLPMNHTYGFNPGILCTLYIGGTVCINVNMKHFRRDLKEYDPYFLSVVPVIAEGIYNSIWAEARRMKKEKLLRRMIGISNFLLRFNIDIRHKVFKDLLNKRLRFISCGGAPLRPELIKLYSEIGIYLINGYGLTECAPLVSVSRQYETDPESVGVIIKEADVKIAEDGEILIKGPNVMLGYYNDPEGTAVCMKDGYFCSGDCGYIKDRRLYITGRKKNIIILDNGKNISPEVIEEKLYALSWVTECMITVKTVHNRPLLCALIYSEEPPDKNKLEADIEHINKCLPEYMHIDDCRLMDGEFRKNSARKILRRLYEEKADD